MAYTSAEEAFADFQRTGQYANSAKHFGGDQAMFGAYKHMIPKQVKQDFRAKVAGNENRAIEGLQQGLTREQMGIFDRPEEGRALYRRLGAGLGSGLDMNKAYNWGGGTAREVGTTDLAKYGTNRGITGDERQRYADFSRAGSPEAYWQQHRGNQIQGLLNSGAIAQDAQGYYNPGPGGGDRYGANLEGYNLGQSPMGQGRGDPRNVGYTPQTISGNVRGGAPQTGGGFNLATYGAGEPSVPVGAAGYSAPAGGGGAPFSGSGSYTPPTGGISGGMNFGIQSAPGGGGVSAGGPGYGGGAPPTAQPPSPMSYGSPGMAYGSGGASGSGAAPATTGAPGTVNRMSVDLQGGGPPGTIYERPPGQVGPFGPPGTGNPSGNSLFPAVTPPGSGGAMDPSGGGGGTGGYVPGWRPEGNLPGVPVTGSGLPPGMGGFQGFEGTPYGGLLGQMGAGDLGIQDFNLARAMAEYGGAQPFENYLGQRYGDVLGYDFQTGQPLQGQAADTANANTFGMMAPEVSRLMGDTDALSQRLAREVPEGGEKTAAQADLLRGAAQQIGGLRQGLAGEAVQGVGNLMQMKKQFDPGGYTGGAQAMLDAYGQGRGQDIGAYGQSLQTMLGQRGQDVTWGLGQGNLGLGWAGLGQQGQQNAWQNYLTGRGQDMDLYSGTRGQDLQRLLAAQQSQTERRGQTSNLIGGLAGAGGTVAAALIM